MPQDTFIDRHANAPPSVSVQTLWLGVSNQFNRESHPSRFLDLVIQFGRTLDEFAKPAFI
jgi:hypothetical protein